MDIIFNTIFIIAIIAVLTSLVLYFKNKQDLYYLLTTMHEDITNLVVKVESLKAKSRK